MMDNVPLPMDNVPFPDAATAGGVVCFSLVVLFAAILLGMGPMMFLMRNRRWGPHVCAYSVLAMLLGFFPVMHFFEFWGLIIYPAALLLVMLILAVICLSFVDRDRRRNLVADEVAVLPAVHQGVQQVSVHHPHLCPECGTVLANDVPEGLCPRCLLHSGLGGAFPSPPESDAQTGAYHGPFIPPAPAELARFFPQMEILGLLGQGGMGAVYKARQVKLDRLVALKILPPEWGKDPAFAERFSREARALAKLSHPHIVAVHDFGEAEGLYYFVMEYVDGANLRQVLQNGHLPPDEALRIVPQLCEALQYAHEEGIVHRDIKPENILLDRRGRVKVADFGLAKLVGPTPGHFTLTGSRQVVGTPHYMAPEQMEKPHTVDHRADIYSLGVVLYEMLTGELPLGRFAPPSRKGVGDARLDEVVMRALEKEPAERYQRVNELQTGLEELLATLPVRQPLPHDATGFALPPEKAAQTNDSRELAEELDQLRLQVVGPGVALRITAALAVVSWAILAGVALEPVASHPAAVMRMLVMMLLLGAPVVLTASGILLVAAKRLTQFRSYEFCVFAAFWAMVPWSFAFPVALPVGIWLYLTLRRPEMRLAFLRNQRVSSSRRPDPNPSTGFLRRKMQSLARAARFWVVDSTAASRASAAAGPASAVQSQGAVLEKEHPPAPARQAGRHRGFPILGVAFLSLAATVGLWAGALGLWYLLGDKKTDGPHHKAVMTTTRLTPPLGKPPEQEYPMPVAAYRYPSMNLQPAQVESLNRILKDAHQEYLALERRYVKRQVVERDQHVRVTIAPFAKELEELEHRVWKQLDQVLDIRQQSEARKGRITAGEWFPHGKDGWDLEIWRMGDWFHWKTVQTGKSGSWPANTGKGPTLPAPFRRFWEEPPAGAADSLREEFVPLREAFPVQPLGKEKHE